MAKKKVSEDLQLSDNHMKTLALGMEKQKNSKLEVSGMDLRIQILRSEIELSKAQIKLKEAAIRELQRMVPPLKQKYTDLKGEEKEALEGIKKDLGITAEKWGYDPDSGEVVISEEEES